jgi:uncharacterized membrane protein YecN with MAPEG domain
MNEIMQKQPWAVALVGLVLVVVGTLGANNQSLSGNPVQLVFDIGAIAGWVLLIGGIVMWVRSRKAGKNGGA